MELLTSTQAAERLGISKRSLWRLTFEQHSALPHVKIGRSIRYTAKDLEEFVLNHREESKNA